MREFHPDQPSASDAKMVVQLTVTELRQLIAEEVRGALAEQKTKQLFDSREAASMLGVPHTWLESKARENKVPYRRLGHYVRYSREDIEQIAKGLVDPPVG